MRAQEQRVCGVGGQGENFYVFIYPKKRAKTELAPVDLHTRLAHSQLRGVSRSTFIDKNQIAFEIFYADVRQQVCSRSRTIA